MQADVAPSTLLPNLNIDGQCLSMGACISWHSAGTLSVPPRTAQVNPLPPPTPSKDDGPPAKTRRICRDVGSLAGVAGTARGAGAPAGLAALLQSQLSEAAPLKAETVAQGGGLRAEDSSSVPWLRQSCAGEKGGAAPEAEQAGEGGGEGGEFPLACSPGLVLRILSHCQLGPRDLAALEASCKFFRAPAGFCPDPELSLTEMGAHDQCMLSSAFRSMSPPVQAAVRERVGGSWKLVLRFLRAREACTRTGKTQVAAGCAHSVVVNSKGEVFSFGHGAMGQLGHAEASDMPWKPRPVRALAEVRIVQVAAGRSRTMVVTEGGGVLHFGRECFGDQEYSLASPSPVFSPSPVLSLRNIHVVQVAMGSFFTAVLSAEGRVYTFAWGAGDRLGHATDPADVEPRVLEGGGLESVPVVQIAGGHCYLLALTCSKERGRAVWSVGCGLGGKLGHGTRSDERAPKEIAHFREIKFEPIAVAAGAWHAVALSADGRVATWGWGRHGCLGHGSDQCETLPRVIQGLARGAAEVPCHVAAGDYTTFVVGKQGEVWAFGSAESSCLGVTRETGGERAAQDGDQEDADVAILEGPRPRSRDVVVPRRVRALEEWPGKEARDKVVHVSTSNAGHWDAHMLALTQRGTVIACGSASKGQLGCSMPEGVFERSVPSPIEGLSL